MSIDLNWETLTTGPDGAELAHRIRDFIHTKFQAVPLPRFIKSVTVHDFQFGSIPPELELKDITDPLPDFYEEEIGDDDEDEDDEDDEDEGGFSSDEVHHGAMPDELRAASERRRRAAGKAAATAPHHDRFHHPHPHHRPDSLPPSIAVGRAQYVPHDLGSPFLGVSTPGIPGGTSNLHYFHSHLATGLSGTQTPLAAVAGAQIGGGWPEAAEGSGGSSTSPSSPPSTLQENRAWAAGQSQQQQQQPSHSRQSSISVVDFPTSSSPSTATTSAAALHPPVLREKSSVSTLAPTSVGTSRPPTRDAAGVLAGSAIAEDDEAGAGGPNGEDEEDGAHRSRRFREPRVEDMQAVFRIRYAGDVKLLLTADILLDYPMPSFVGIPLRLSITGLTFDGVGVLAYIRRRVHFCFLSPEDAVAAVGAEEGGLRSAEEQDGGDGGSGGGGEQQEHGRSTGRLGGLLQEIKVESEIGQREGGKQSLKNVGKVERFVLEQVRRIFEEEFVYPSFWTFLV